MAKSRHNGAFIFGAMLGGAVGAVAALWNTPQSGAELRRKLGFESEAASSVTSAAKQAASTATSLAQSARPLPSRALGLVEQAAAPLVGVKLGQTANNSQPGGVNGTAGAAAPTAASTIPVSAAPQAGTIPVMPPAAK
jgi:gas vesicle protein